MTLCCVSVLVVLFSLNGVGGAMRSLWELPENFRYTFLGLESPNNYMPPLNSLTDEVDVPNKPVKPTTQDWMDLRGQKHNKHGQDQRKEFRNPFMEFLQPGNLLEYILQDKLELNGQHGKQASPFFQDVRKQLLDRIGPNLRALAGQRMLRNGNKRVEATRNQRPVKVEEKKPRLEPRSQTIHKVSPEVKAEK